MSNFKLCKYFMEVDTHKNITELLFKSFVVILSMAKNKNYLKKVVAYFRMTLPILMGINRRMREQYKINNTYQVKSGLSNLEDS